MKRVLIIEDDPMVCMIHKRYIEQYNYFSHIDTAMTLESALDIIKNHSIDLIVLDVFLPKQTGFEILRDLRLKGVSAYVIMVTAANTPEDVKKAFKLGVLDYLIKPFEYDRLKRALDKFKQLDEQVNDKITLDQAMVDEMLFHESLDRLLPKGIGQETLDLIYECILEVNQDFSSQTISIKTGISSVTVKKYLDYLVVIGKLHSYCLYGKGRPTTMYRCL